MARSIFIITVVLTLAQAVFGQTLAVKEIRVEAQEVVFWNRETGEELVIRPGDVIEGWTVEEITDKDLIISYLGEDNVIHTTNLPLRMRAGIHMPHP